MIKKIIILTVLVIILVSLNWFRTVMAQDLSSLSEEQKALLQQYQQTQANTKSDDYSYQSSNMFDEADKANLEIQQTDENLKALAGKKITQAPSMPSFENLLPFGMDLFNGRKTLESPVGIASAADYILGPGDNVIIYLWGRVDKEFKLTIDREGKLFIPKVGEIICWGLSLDKFTKVAKKQFSKVYSEFEITISLGKIRSIQIYITGEVNKPGAYTVSSLTSFFDALYLGGGPNERGSMRKIKLMRSGIEVSAVDLYKLLLEGDNRTDVKLLNGDVIFVPVVGPQVAIRGEIRRSAIYELLGGESASDLLTLAGNPTPQARLERIMLERISDKSEWQVLDINVKKEEENILLTGGDRLTVYSIFKAKKNTVAIFGKVKHSGYYERSDSLRISDLIKQSQLQDYDVYYQRADLYRLYENGKRELVCVNLQEIINGNIESDLLMNNKDSLHIYSIDEIEIDKYVYIEGEVKNPGRYPLYENMTVEDLIFQAGSFLRGALSHSGEIARLNSLSEVNLINLNLKTSDAQKTQLKEDDHLYIRQIPQWSIDRSVSISGEVLFPGKYTLANRNETLWQLIRRAGGFTRQAFPKGLIFKRQSIKENLNRLNIAEIIDRTSPVKEDTLGNLRKKEIIHFDLSSMDRIILDMEMIIASNGQNGDIVLQPNDQLYIPAIPSGISVIGAVSANGTLKYVQGESVKYYLEKAGGYSRHADKKETQLIKASGEIITNGKLKRKLVEIGDVIIVPTKYEKEKNWSKAFTNTVTTLTGILTSVYIISKL